MAHRERVPEDRSAAGAAGKGTAMDAGALVPSPPASVRDRDQSLIDEARRGETEALYRLLMLHHATFLRLAWKFGVHRDSVEDLFQEVSLKLLNCLPRLRIRSSFAGLLFSIVRTVVRGEWGRKPRRLAEGEDVPWLPAGAETDEEFSKLWECEEGLGEREARMVEGRYYLGLPYRDLASELGITVNNAYQVHARALASLRECLQGKGVAL